MSFGAKVVSHIIKEVTPGVTHTGTWDTLRLTGNALTPTVNTEVSDEITDTGLSQGSVATSIDIGEDLTAEFSFGSFDQLLEAAFYGAWTADVLRVGEPNAIFIWVIALCSNERRQKICDERYHHQHKARDWVASI